MDLLLAAGAFASGVLIGAVTVSTGARLYRSQRNAYRTLWQEEVAYRERHTS